MASFGLLMSKGESMDDFDSRTWHNRLAINLQNLHRDIAEHPAYYAEIAEIGAEAKAAMHAAKANKDVIDAEVASEIRSNPEKFGLTKVTEASIKEALTMDSRVRSAQSMFLGAQENSEMIAVLVNAFEHRRSMLNNEVQLYIANYWTENTPVVSSDDKQALREERIDAVRAKRSGKGG